MAYINYIVANPGILVVLVPLFGSLAISILIGVSMIIEDIRN